MEYLLHLRLKLIKQALFHFRHCVLYIFLFGGLYASAQSGRKITIRGANSLEFDDRVAAQRLVGNVVLNTKERYCIAIAPICLMEKIAWKPIQMCG